MLTPIAEFLVPPPSTLPITTNMHRKIYFLQICSIVSQFCLKTKMRLGKFPEDMAFYSNGNLAVTTIICQSLKPQIFSDRFIFFNFAQICHRFVKKDKFPEDVASRELQPMQYLLKSWNSRCN